MTDTIMAVPLDKCSYVPKAKRLYVPQNALQRLPGQGRFPSTFFVRSHVTNKLLEFKSIQPGDPLFDEDQWDGEMMIYRPRNGVTSKIDYAVVVPEEMI